MAALPKAFLLPTLTSPPEARPLGDVSPKFLRGKYGSCDHGEGGVSGCLAQAAMSASEWHLEQFY